MLQGSAFVEPVDTPERKEQKKRITHFNSYVKALQTLTPRHFEALCAGVVNKLGVSNPVLTRSSFDEGIDFYGTLKLEDLIHLQGRTVGVERQLAIWIIGQAKHYQAQNVSTFDIRDLVGAVELARGKAFGMIASKYQDLNIRVCDPVFYFFITTGKMSSATWHLLEKGGVVGMDGHMVASFLAGHKVGLKDESFHRPALMKWIGSYLRDEAH